MPANNLMLVFEREKEPPDDGLDQHRRRLTRRRARRLAIAETRAWVRRAVIGLNLCPFARAVHVKDQIRYVFSDATDAETLLATLMDELQRLSDTDPEPSTPR